MLLYSKSMVHLLDTIGCSDTQEALREFVFYRYQIAVWQVKVSLGHKHSTPLALQLLAAQ